MSERLPALERINGVLEKRISGETFNGMQAYYIGRVPGVDYQRVAVEGSSVVGRTDLAREQRGVKQSDGSFKVTPQECEDRIAAGDEVHDAVIRLAMFGYSVEQISDMVANSPGLRSREGGERRIRDLLGGEIESAVNSATRKRLAEAEKLLAKIAAPERPEALNDFAVSSLAGKPVPERQWIVPNLIPARQPSLISGDGGLGKSLLMLQLGIAVATGGKWLGMPVQRGPVLYLSCEDDEREIQIRVAKMADLATLRDFHIKVLTEDDPILMGHVGRDFNVTTLYGRLAKRIEELRPVLVVLDSAADVFGGNEIIRAEVRAFIGKLRALAHSFGPAIVILAHPSAAGVMSGSGMSGSTHWSNSVRSRLYLRRPKPAESNDPPDPNLRELELMKSNYAASGQIINLELRDMQFVNLDEGAARYDAKRAAADKADTADELFIRLLDKYTEQRRYVTSAKNSTSAPNVFADDPEARAAKIGKADFRSAMNRLFNKGRITNRERKVSGHMRQYLAAVDHAPIAE
jgi:RecA-family ATPase